MPIIPYLQSLYFQDLLRRNCTIKNIQQKEFRQFFPKDGWVEHDAEEIWNDVKKLIQLTIKKNKLKPGQIVSIGITNQRETTVLWNKITGKPLYKAIV